MKLLKDSNHYKIKIVFSLSRFFCLNIVITLPKTIYSNSSVFLVYAKNCYLKHKGIDVLGTKMVKINKTSSSLEQLLKFQATLFQYLPGRQPPISGYILLWQFSLYSWISSDIYLKKKTSIRLNTITENLIFTGKVNKFYVDAVTSLLPICTISTNFPICLAWSCLSI